MKVSDYGTERGSRGWRARAASWAKRATRKCLGSRTPGSNAEPPKAILTRANRGPPRKPSAYNLHIKEQMAQNREAIPTHKERFANAVRLWNAKKRT